MTRRKNILDLMAKAMRFVYGNFRTEGQLAELERALMLFCKNEPFIVSLYPPTRGAKEVHYRDLRKARGLLRRNGEAGLMKKMEDGMDIRTYNLWKDLLGRHSLSAILIKTESELVTCAKGAGKVTVDKLSKRLSNFGLRLGMHPDEVRFVFDR